MKVPAYILAGGESRRFGSDKARAVVEGMTLLEHAARSLAHASTSVFVVASKEDAYEDLGFHTIPDHEAGMGPLGGVNAALHDAARREGATWVLVTACDWVGLRRAWIDALLAEASRVDVPVDARPAGKPAPRAIAFRASTWEPLPALYHTSLTSETTVRLERGRLALWQLLDDVRARALARPDDWGSARQMNVPDR